MLRRRWQRDTDSDFAGRGDSGYTILEIVVAVGVIFVAMVAMAHSATIALIDVGYARQRQSATGLANKVMEQVRALPATTVRLGLSGTDLATSDDPNITTTTVGGITRYLYNGEELLTHTPVDATEKPPLIPHRVQQTVGPTTYWVAVYTTLMPDGETVRVTTDVSWADTALRRGTSARVQAQSLFSPGVGCGTALDENPYGAPCAASFEAEAFIDEASVTVRTNDDTTDFQDATLTLPRSYARLDVGQVNVVRSIATTSGATLTVLFGPLPRAGGSTADVTSSSDPATGTPPYVSTSVGPQMAQSLESTAPMNRVRVTTGANDTGTAIAASAARGLAGQSCYNPDGFDQTDHLPCGNANSQQGGTVTAQLLLPDGTMIPLASIELAPEQTTAVVDRTVSPSSTTCGLEGCAAAKVTRGFGAVSIGGTPDNTSWLATVEGLTDSASAGTGEGAGPPTAAVSGMIRHDTGTVDIATLGATAHVFNPARAYTSGVYSVEMGGSFTARGATTDDPAAGEAGCTSVCRRTSASATSGSPLNGSFSIRVTTADGDDADDLPDVVADLTVKIDLGRAHARATYESAPGAL